MDYISRSLSKGEKLVIVGRYHWIYYVGAVFWLVLGVLACLGIIALGVIWNGHQALNAAYPTLPDHLFWQGWANIVASKGGYIGMIRALHIAIKLLALGALIVGTLFFSHMMLVRLTTEIAVTTDRLVLKEGILSRNVGEMNIDRIESVQVIQSILGRWMGFGTIIVRGMGIGEIVLPPLAKPIVFRNAIDRARQYQEKTR